jgi:hypothetical protein
MLLRVVHAVTIALQTFNTWQRETYHSKEQLHESVIWRGIQW